MGRYFSDHDGLAACYDLVAKLEQQLRIANRLREELEREAQKAAVNNGSSEAGCRQLVDGAVEISRASAMLRERLCGRVVAADNRTTTFGKLNS